MAQIRIRRIDLGPIAHPTTLAPAALADRTHQIELAHSGLRGKRLPPGSGFLIYVMMGCLRKLK